MCGQEQIYIESDIKEEYDKKIRELNELDDYIVRLNLKLMVLADQEENIEHSEVDLRIEKKERANKNIERIGVLIFIGAIAFLIIGIFLI